MATLQLIALLLANDITVTQANFAGVYQHLQKPPVQSAYPTEE